MEHLRYSEAEDMLVGWPPEFTTMSPFYFVASPSCRLRSVQSPKSSTYGSILNSWCWVITGRSLCSVRKCANAWCAEICQPDLSFRRAFS
eukprot:791769-Amphidinium_carterae.1